MIPGSVEYSEDVALEIAAKLAEGKSLRSICKLPNMPSIRAIYEWRKTKPEFDALIMAAKQDQADSLADDIFDAIDKLENAETMVQVSKQREKIQALQWIASKLKPQAYGQQKQELAITTSYVDALKEINENEGKGRNSRSTASLRAQAIDNKDITQH